MIPHSSLESMPPLYTGYSTRGLSLPLDRGRGLGGDVEDDAVDLGHRVRDARGDAGQHVVGQARPVGRHRVLGGHRPQHDGVAVGAPVALDAHAAHVGEQHHGALPDLLVQASGGELLAGDQVRGAQDVQALARHLADDADPQARTREGLAVHQVVGQAQLAAHRAHLVLEEGTQGLDSVTLDELAVRHIKAFGHPDIQRIRQIAHPVQHGGIKLVGNALRGQSSGFAPTLNGRLCL